MNCRVIASKTLLSFFAVGVVTATVLAGCGGGSNNTGAGGAAGKDAGAAGRGGSTGLAGQPAGGTTVPSGGVVGPDAGVAGSGGTPDAAATGGRTGADAAAGATGAGGTGGSAGAAGADAGSPPDAQPDTGRSDISVDAPPDGPSDVSIAGDAAQEASDADGSSSDTSNPAGCASPAWAETFNPNTTNIASFAGLASDKDGNLFASANYYQPQGSSARTLDLGAGGSIPAAAGSNVLVARLDPSTGAFVWGKGFGDDPEQVALGVAVDKSGRVGVVGQYQGSMTFGADTFANTGTTFFAFMGALDSNGTVLWGKSMDLGGTASTPSRLAIAAHPKLDDFVVCGSATNAAKDLVAGATPNADGKKDIVVAKIKGADKSVVWASLVGGAGNQACNAVVVAGDGSVLIAGGYGGTLDFGSGAFPVPSNASATLPWVAKLDGTDGHVVVATSFGTAATAGVHTVRSLDVDDSGNVVIAGGFTGSIAYGSATLTSGGATDGFAVKLDPSLHVLWAKSWGDTDNQDVKGVAFDSAGDVTIVGPFASTMAFGPDRILTSSGANDAYVAKLAGTTGVALCAARYGDTGPQDATLIAVSRFATGVQKDAAFVSGVFISELDFGLPSPQKPLNNPSIVAWPYLLRVDHP